MVKRKLIYSSEIMDSKSIVYLPFDGSTAAKWVEKGGERHR